MKIKNNLYKITTIAVFLVYALFAAQNIFANNQININKSKIKWSGSKIIGASSHYGNVKIKSANIKVKKNTFTGVVIIDMNTIYTTDLSGTDKEKLEKHLKSKDFFNVKSYPIAKITINKTTKKTSGKYQIDGKLKIRGISKPITFPAKVTFSKDGNFKSAKGKMIFDRTDFNVRYGAKKFSPVDIALDRIISDEIKIKFDIRS